MTPLKTRGCGPAKALWARMSRAAPTARVETVFCVNHPEGSDGHHDRGPGDVNPLI